MNIFERWGYRIVCHIAWCLLLRSKDNAALANIVHDLDKAIASGEFNNKD